MKHSNTWFALILMPSALLLSAVMIASAQPSQSPERNGTPESKSTQVSNQNQKSDQSQTRSQQWTPTQQQQADAKNTPSADTNQDAIQKRIEAFTGLLVLVGALQFFALLGQGIVFYYTLRINQRLTKASVIAARATRASVRQMRDTAERQLRAYVSVLVGNAIFQERNRNFKFEARPLMLNTGHTPAHKVGYRAAAAILSIPLPADFDFPLPEQTTGASVLGPQQNFTMSGIVSDFVDDADVYSIKKGEGRALYVWGIITYEDIFHCPHETKFSQIITWLPDNKILGYFTPQHNTAT